VDAFPGLNFDGKVTQIRLQPITKSNVVTYTVIVQAPNPDLKLMPGMTASITVYVEEARDVLVLSSKALHFTPDPQVLMSYFENLPDKNLNKQPPVETEMMKDTTSVMVWVKKGVEIKPVPVKVGIDDDMNAQIIEGLNLGDEVVYSMDAGTNSTISTAPAQTSSPFMPRPPGSRTTTTKKS
jgi:HlyD family secretion protein